MSNKMEIESVAYEQSDRGYMVRASYLREPHKANAVIEIFKDGNPLRCFLFPAYKIFNIAAHFSDIVDSEIAGDVGGYAAAAWDGIGGAIVVLPAPPEQQK